MSAWGLLLEVDEDIITAGTAGVLVGKLLQFCNGAVYGNEGQVVPVHDCKLEAYTELLEGLNGEHCLTFYGYQHDKDRILERLEKWGRGRADKLRVRVYKGVEDEEAWNAGLLRLRAQPPGRWPPCGMVWLKLEFRAERPGQLPPVPAGLPLRKGVCALPDCAGM